TAYEICACLVGSEMCIRDSSRIAHLVVIDVLAMGVAMARGPDLVNHLKSVKRSLRSLRLSPKVMKNQEERGEPS
ncbi:hypothetical protein FA567_28325, partial [Pseudomonas aeruginosa]|nr:hypothetical protein [Pseudomonas aeruginosa]